MAIAKPGSWTFTGTLIDFADDRRRCDFCSRPGMRFGCQVETRVKGGGKPVNAYVGSDCLIDAGFRLSDDYSSDQFHSDKSALMRDATQRAIVRELIRLKVVLSELDWAKEISLSRLIQSVQRYSLLTPNQLLFLLSINRRAKFDFPVLLLRVTTKKKAWRDQLSELGSDDTSTILPFLTESQRQWVHDSD